MQALHFFTRLKALENSNLSLEELNKVRELLEKVETNLGDEGGEFLENLFFNIVSKYNFIRFKNVIDSFKEALGEWIEFKAKNTRLKNYDSKKQFWQESEILRRYFCKKAYENLPRWAV